MLTFIGDCHGCFKSYLYILSCLPKDAISFQLGDMGIGFGEELIIPNEYAQHKFIRGNHDNPELCELHPNYLGDYGFLKDYNLFFLSGGYSIDKNYRTPYVSWWPDEELSYSQGTKALDLYRETKPEIIISHECPSILKPYVLTNAWKKEIISSTESLLQTMLEQHQPKYWICAHHHKFTKIIIDNTTFVCLDMLRQTMLNKRLAIKGQHIYEIEI